MCCASWANTVAGLRITSSLTERRQGALAARLGRPVGAGGGYGLQAHGDGFSGLVGGARRAGKRSAARTAREARLDLSLGHFGTEATFPSRWP